MSPDRTSNTDRGYTPQNLRVLLARHGVTKKHCAELLGVHPSTVSCWCADVGSTRHQSMRAVVWVSLVEQLEGIAVVAEQSQERGEASERVTNPLSPFFDPGKPAAEPESLWNDPAPRWWLFEDAGFRVDSFGAPLLAEDDPVFMLQLMAAQDESERDENWYLQWAIVYARAWPILFETDPDRLMQYHLVTPSEDRHSEWFMQHCQIQERQMEFRGVDIVALKKQFEDVVSAAVKSN